MSRFLFSKRKDVVALFIIVLVRYFFSFSHLCVRLSFFYISTFHFLQVWVVYFWFSPVLNICSGASVHEKVRLHRTPCTGKKQTGFSPGQSNFVTQLQNMDTHVK